MGWILPPGGVPELAHTIAHNLYGKPPVALQPAEQDIVVAWIAGRTTVPEAEVRAGLLVSWTAANDDRGRAGQSVTGEAAASSAVAARSVNGSALGVRLQQLAPTTAPKTPIPSLTLWEGARSVDDRATFEALARTTASPGAPATRELKFLILDAQSDAPQVVFMNTNAYEAHHAFAKGALRQDVDLATFNANTYFRDDRDVIAGSVVAYDHADLPGHAGVEGPKGLYALQFLPTDPLTPALVQTAFDLVSQAAPFVAGKLAYHATGDGQREAAARGQDALRAAGIPVVTTDALLADVPFSPLNPGTGFGVLRVIDGSDPRPATGKDVVIFRQLPNDLSRTAGVITLDPQTPLSHVNLKAKQNNTPNAFIKGALDDPAIKKLIGSVVRFEVTDRGYTLRAATAEEAATHLEALRPTKTTKPPRDLSKTKPAPLSSIGHQDLDAYGAKSANAGELLRALPASQALEGQAVPFAFYDAFMRESGLYDVVTRLMSEPRFQTDETYRHNQLSKFRRQMRNTPLPKALAAQVQALQDSFPAGSPLRLRSSTNNEDLQGFNGAGLYASRRYDPNDKGPTASPTFEAAMKNVWSSLWSFRAFEERSFHRIDHLTTAMGVLVHADQKSDGVAGVGVTKNLYDKSWPGLYVNVQRGDDQVTNPEGGAVPEELLFRLDQKTGRYQAQTLRRSNVVPDGVEPDAPVLTAPQQRELTSAMDAVQKHFRGVYGAHGDDTFAMDLEFIVQDGKIRVLQARPWVDGA